MTAKEKNIERNERLVNDSFNEIYTFDAVSYKFTYLNTSALNNLGYTMEEMIELTPVDIKPDYDINSFEKLVFPLRNKKKTKIQFYTNHQRKDGTLYPVEVHLQLNSYEKTQYFSAFIIDITERKHAENAYKLSDTKFKDLFDKSGDALLIIKNNIFIDCNMAVCNMLGYTSKKEFLNVHPSKLSPKMQPDGKESFKKAEKMMRLAYKNSSHRFEWIHTKKSGEDFPVEVLLTTITNLPNNKVIYCVWRDITKRKETDKILLENEHRLSSIYNTVGDVIFYLDVISKDVYKFNSVNKSFCNVTGLSEDMIIGKLVNEIIPEPSLSLILKKYQQAINKNSILRWEETTNYPKGKITGEVSIAPIFNTNGQCSHLVGTVHDITERKKAEQIIKESEYSLLEAQKLAKIGSYNLDLGTNIAETSANFNEMVGIDLNCELTFALWRTITHPEDTPTNQKVLEKCLKTGEKFDLEYRILTKNTQELKWIHGLGEVNYKNGAPANFFGTIQDITKQKRAQFDLENAYTQVEELKNQLEEENIYLKKEIALSFNYEDMVYSSTEISDVLTQVEQVAVTDATVLILGETGTGKELIAKAIHNTSDRKNKTLIRVNCAAIPNELIESELFGHVKGSFTGAIKNRIGKFELANGGTLFLDEIGEMPLALQPKLLRAIQEGEIEPIGSSKIRKLNIRIIAATNKNLRKEVENKQFREDLYFRLNVFPITIPPLRERIEDIPILIDHFVNKYSLKHEKKIKYIPDETLQQMKSYAWPGNVRELENLIERAVIISNQDLLIIKEFEATTERSTNIKHQETSLEDVQRNHVIKILKETKWKIDGKEGAAVKLNIKPSTLRDRMKKLGIIRPKR
jgi:PAS domain S-box-containing protein